jgi:putative phosphonate metabolism protein
MTARYAIYYAPRSSTDLWRFGSAILGYDAETGEDIPFPPGEPFDGPDWRGLTEEPRRYGFHGTMKATFHLKPGASEGALLAESRRFAGEQTSFEVPELTVALLGSFVALVPDGLQPRLDGLAAECTRSLDRFRASLTAADRARRLSAPLSERQVRHLDEWGYPYVFEDFRFHMTLTGSLPPEKAEPVRVALAAKYARLPPGLRVDGVTVFRQADREGHFRVLERFPLGR